MEVCQKHIETTFGVLGSGPVSFHVKLMAFAKLTAKAGTRTATSLHGKGLSFAALKAYIQTHRPGSGKLHKQATLCELTAVPEA